MLGQVTQERVASLLLSLTLDEEPHVYSSQDRLEVA